jgi:hypothetical protein
MYKPMYFKSLNTYGYAVCGMRRPRTLCQSVTGRGPLPSTGEKIHTTYPISTYDKR